MSNLGHLKFNDHAPDVELLNIKGQTVRLSSLWKKTALLLAFSRHFGCPQCKAMVDMLAGISNEIESGGLSLVIITQGTPEEARAFCAEHIRHVICLSDPRRVSYRAYRLQRANLWQTFLSPHVWNSNFRLWHKKGWKTELPPKGQDAMQMGGIFVIGKNGRIHLPYYYDDIADHPPLDLLLHGVLGVNWNKPLEKPVIPAHRPAKRKTKLKK